MSKFYYRLFLFIFSVSFLFPGLAHCQSDGEFFKQRGDVRIMFYNTENYFDIYDDTLKNDSEFLPDSDKKWTYDRYREKTLNIYRTIAAVGGISPPEIVAFAEIENKNVLYELVKRTPLERFDYGIVHYESPDIRGIDVALIYLKKKIKVVSSENIEIIFPDNSNRKTRDILYIKCLVMETDTLHFFINHWPSRVGGENRSAPNRAYVATVLKDKTDSILAIDSCSRILIMGDFNDEPNNESIKKYLLTENSLDKEKCRALYNLSEFLPTDQIKGTYRYQAEWNMLDQAIVSGGLLFAGTGLTTMPDQIHIGEFRFLLQDESKYGGVKPYRTYLGPVYKGGFSDHLPIYLDLYLK